MAVPTCSAPPAPDKCRVVTRAAPEMEFVMDVYIPEEYVVKRRAERRAAARRAATDVDGGGEEKAGRSSWTASWPDADERRKASASVITERRGEDVILAYLSA